MNALTAIRVLGPLAFVVSPLALQAGPGNKTMRVYSARMETLFIRLDVNSDGRLDASEVQGRRGLSPGTLQPVRAGLKEQIVPALATAELPLEQHVEEVELSLVDHHRVVVAAGIPKGDDDVADRVVDHGDHARC